MFFLTGPCPIRVFVGWDGGVSLKWCDYRKCFVHYNFNLRDRIYVDRLTVYPFLNRA